MRDACGASIVAGRAGGRGPCGAGTVAGVFNHPETPQDAAAEVIRATNAYPNIRGWAMIGGWPLFTTALLDPRSDRFDRESERIGPAAIDMPRQGPHCRTATYKAIL